MPNALRTEQGGFSPVPRRGAVAVVTTILAVLLLFSFRTADQTGPVLDVPTAPVIGAPGRSLLPGPTVGTTPFPSPRSAPGATPGPTRPPATDAPGSVSGTFTGKVIRTQYGNVQVAVVIDAGKIVDVQALQLPGDRRLSQQISQEAGPQLRDEVLAAQSANIDGVSGASYTSEGYDESLQSALAQVP